MRCESIQNIRRRFHREWLLIKVEKLDHYTTKPLLGQLVAHSPDREEIYQKSVYYKGLTLIDYSEDKLPVEFTVSF